MKFTKWLLLRLLSSDKSKMAILRLALLKMVTVMAIPERYIEVQMWSDKPIKYFRTV
jgi:hypothetical protein